MTSEIATVLPAKSANRTVRPSYVVNRRARIDAGRALSSGVPIRFMALGAPESTSWAWPTPDVPAEHADRHTTAASDAATTFDRPTSAMITPQTGWFPR